MTAQKFVLGRKFIAHHYNKSDVETHSAGYYAPYYPAVNVKVHRFPQADDIADHFHCSEETAQKAAEYAWETAQTCFWENVQGTAEDVFGKGVKAYSAGRSSGWVIIDGLTEIESWDAIDLAKWRKFEKIIKAEVKYRTSKEVVFEDIEANRWAEDGAEQYNFIDTKDGQSHCIVDLKKQDRQSD